MESVRVYNNEVLLTSLYAMMVKVYGNKISQKKSSIVHSDLGVLRAFNSKHKTMDIDMLDSFNKLYRYTFYKVNTGAIYNDIFKDVYNTYL